MPEPAANLSLGTGRLTCPEWGHKISKHHFPFFLCSFHSAQVLFSTHRTSSIGNLYPDRYALVPRSQLSSGDRKSLVWLRLAEEPDSLLSREEAMGCSRQGHSVFTAQTYNPFTHTQQHTLHSRVHGKHCTFVHVAHSHIAQMHSGRRDISAQGLSWGNSSSLLFPCVLVIYA